MSKVELLDSLSAMTVADLLNQIRKAQLGCYEVTLKFGGQNDPVEERDPVEEPTVTPLKPRSVVPYEDDSDVEIAVTTELLKDLYKKAENADSSSRWQLSKNGSEVVCYNDDEGHFQTVVYTRGSDDGKFIAAANPTVVMALIAEIESLRASLCNLNRDNVNLFDIGTELKKELAEAKNEIERLRRRK